MEQETARVLGGAVVEPSLSFLENGGDSLRALQLITALRRRGLQLGLEQLLSDTPIRELTWSRSDDTGVTGARKEMGNWILPTRRFLATRGIPDLRSVVPDLCARLHGVRWRRKACGCRSGRTRQTYQ
ncbi:acyl carrier protein [Bradyrhizobium sp. BR 1432]|uniref:acyl carrier protein n=1 Tax=Bradyrhizobium sp. BR 1432 TaxID=3447966 RepID=UPI003EE7EDDB